MDSFPNENVCHAGWAQHSVRIHKRPPSSTENCPVAGLIKTPGRVTVAGMPVFFYFSKTKFYYFFIFNHKQLRCRIKLSSCTLWEFGRVWNYNAVAFLKSFCKPSETFWYLGYHCFSDSDFGFFKFDDSNSNVGYLKSANSIDSAALEDLS